MSKFQVGDHALTLVGVGRLLPAGSVVELYRPFRKGEALAPNRQDRVFTEDGWWCAHAELGDRLPFAERNLMPLRGSFQQQFQRELEQQQ